MEVFRRFDFRIARTVPIGDVFNVMSSEDLDQAVQNSVALVRRVEEGVVPRLEEIYGPALTWYRFH